MLTWDQINKTGADWKELYLLGPAPPDETLKEFKWRLYLLRALMLIARRSKNDRYH